MKKKKNKKPMILAIAGGIVVSALPQSALASWELTQWGNDLLNVGEYHQAGITGKQIKVAVLDTGIAADHPELNVVQHVSFVEGETAEDFNGHGTVTAGIIAAKDDDYGVVGVAPDVALYNVKVLNKSGKTENITDVAKAIRWCIENDIDIISLSLGSLGGTHPDVQLALEEAEQAGILVVASSGNHGDTAPGIISTPAKVSSVIAVGAINSNQTLWEESATGKELDFVAPGVNINSTYLNGQYASSTGTSGAAPFVTGILALLMEAHPDKTYVELREMLLDNAIDLGELGFDEQYGYGLVQLPSLVLEEPEQEEPVEEIPNESEPLQNNLHYDSSSNVIQWDVVDGASRYRIEIEQKEETGNYESFSYARSISETSFSLNNLEQGHDYKLTVTPRIGWIYDENQSFAVEVSKEEFTVIEKIPEVPPTVGEATVSINGTTAALTWDVYNLAEGYRIQPYVKGETGIFVKSGNPLSTTGTSYTINNLKEGEEYKFAIVPRINVYDEKRQGFTESVLVPISEVPAPPVEEVITAQAAYDGTNVTVSWSKLEDVTTYRVQRYVKNEGGEFEKDGFYRRVVDQVYADTGIAEGKEYKYQIIPLVKGIYNVSRSVTTDVIVNQP